MMCCPDCGAEMLETATKTAVDMLLSYVCPWHCSKCLLCCHDEETVECKNDKS